MVGFVIPLTIAVISGALFWYVYRQAVRLPVNRPEAFLHSSNGSHGSQVVVCAGDSITHAAVSADYVRMLEDRFDGSGYRFINAGVNSELAYNLRQRLDDIIACKPDVVTVLIGTNDVNALVTENLMTKYINEQKLPVEPDIDWYRDNLEAIVQRLTDDTGARLALLSLPLLGEELESEANRNTAIYSEVVKAVAEKYGAAYLPLNEQQVGMLQAHNHVPRSTYRGERSAMYKAIAKRHLLRRSWDAIADEGGFMLLTDHIHLNDRAAAGVADLIGHFLENGSKR